MTLSSTFTFLIQLSRCDYTITLRKPYIASLEIWTIGLWTVGSFDCNLIQMDDYPADSCAISPTAFLLILTLKGGVTRMLTWQERSFTRKLQFSDSYNLSQN